MKYYKRSFEELDVMDDFLMSALAGDPEVGEAFCKKLLSVLLQREIGKIDVVVQRTIPGTSPLKRGIRLDVEIEETEETESGDVHIVNVYDMEPHRQRDGGLPKRNRFYQAKIDSRYLKKGEKNFANLPNLYVITITDYDPFGEEQMIYNVHNQCEEVPDMQYADGLRFVYFYTNGRKGGCEAIRNMLRYICNSRRENVLDDATQDIHSYVEQVKLMPEVKLDYMRLDEYIEYHIQMRMAEREEAEQEERQRKFEELQEKSQKELSELQEEKQRELEELQEKSQKELSELQEEKQRELEELQEKSQKELEELQEKSQKELEELQEKSQKELEELQEKKQRELEELQEKSQKELEELQEKKQKELSELQEKKQKELREQQEKAKDEAGKMAAQARLEMRRLNIKELLLEYGALSEVLVRQIDAEADVDKLKQWLKLASKVDSIAEFEKHMSD